MTHADYKAKRDEILDNLIDWAESGRTSMGRPSAFSPEEAAQALDALLLEVVGEDEAEPYVPGTTEDGWRLERNNVRASIRAIVEGEK